MAGVEPTPKSASSECSSDSVGVGTLSLETKYAAEHCKYEIKLEMESTDRATQATYTILVDILRWLALLGVP